MTHLYFVFVMVILIFVVLETNKNRIQEIFNYVASGETYSERATGAVTKGPTSDCIAEENVSNQN